MIALRVESLIHLGEKVNAGGGCLSAVTAGVRVGWMKSWELSWVLRGRKWSVAYKMEGVRARMVYGGESWAMRK